MTIKYKFLSIILAAIIIFVITVPNVYADDVITYNSSITTEYVDGTMLYSYVENGTSYCIQIEENGLANVSSCKEDSDIIYNSVPFVAETAVNKSLNYKKLDRSSINSIKDYSEGIGYSTIKVEYIAETEKIVFEEVEKPGIAIDEISINTTLASAPSNTLVKSASKSSAASAVKAEWGSNYTNKLLKSKSKTYGKNYTLSCYESQSTYLYSNRNFDFAAKTALSVIAAWIATGKFSMTIGWFISAAEASKTTLNGISVINKRIHGTVYYYEISWIRKIKCSSVTTDVLYSASRRVDECYVYSATSNKWDGYIDSDYKQAVFDNFEQQFSNAFTRLVQNYLT